MDAVLHDATTLLLSRALSAIPSLSVLVTRLLGCCCTVAGAVIVGVRVHTFRSEVGEGWIQRRRATWKHATYTRTTHSLYHT